MKSKMNPHTLQNLAAAYSGRELHVNPEYQRGTKWNLAQKQGLIDSLMRGYQIPLFYVHLLRKVNNFTGSIDTTAQLVDGQQRLAAIVSYLKNEFHLPDLLNVRAGAIIPVCETDLPSWNGKKFEDLSHEDKDLLNGRELQVVEMNADSPNEVRDLFIRLQAGTPLTAQEKRDAWPGDFTDFIIRHAGKPGHPHSNPKPFFKLVPRKSGLTVDDGDHYVDGLADTRKFFAGLAMTIMVRERTNEDFVDLKGKIINDFYKDNLDLNEDDPGVRRVIRVLDLIPQLPGFDKLLQGKSMSFQMAFHFALLVDSLVEGDFVPIWRDDVVNAFIEFRKDEVASRHHYKNTKEPLPHYERFVRLLGGSGSDTADVIRMRHSFLLSEVYTKIRLRRRDTNRCFDALEKELIWNRDKGLCKNPECKRRVSFREATIHHVIEHTAGGSTTIQNGILVCPECHVNRNEMQHLTTHFQDYLNRIYTGNQNQTDDEIVIDSEIDTNEAQPEAENNANGYRNGIQASILKIIIDWGLLDVEREEQTISGNSASDTVVKLLVELINAFGEQMKQQLTELPIVRFPLSKNPTSDFINRTTGRSFGSIPVPGTDLYFCSHSDNAEKVRRLNQLFSRLSLPDSRNFPPDSIRISIEQ